MLKSVFAQSHTYREIHAHLVLTANLLKVKFTDQEESGFHSLNKKTTSSSLIFFFLQSVKSKAKKKVRKRWRQGRARQGEKIGTTN